jgi:hypothetical protein
MGDSVEKPFSIRPSETAGAIMATRRAGIKGSAWGPRPACEGSGADKPLRT